MQSTYDKGCDELIDESGAIDICAHCAAEGKLQPGLYFCCQCGPFGRYICGDCNKQHKKFLNGHKIRDVSTAAKQPGGSSNMQVDEITQAKQQLESLVKEIETRREVIDKVIPDGELARNIYEVRKKLSKDNSNAQNEIEEIMRKLKELETNLERRHARLFPAEGSSLRREANLDKFPPGKRTNLKSEQKPANTERTTIEVLSNVERFADSAQNEIEKIMRSLIQLETNLERRHASLFPAEGSSLRREANGREERPSTDRSSKALTLPSQSMNSKLKSKISTHKAAGTSSKSEQTPLTLLSNVQTIALRFASKAEQMSAIVNQRDEELKHVDILWELTFGEESPDSTSGRKGRVFDATSRLKMIVDELRRLDTLSQNLEEQCSLLYKDTKGSEMPAQDFKSPIDHLAGTIQNIQACQEETTEIRKCLDNMCIFVNVKVQGARLSEKCSQLAEELKRLSKMAGAKLTDNNPNIADLSDPNRPTKLAEMYSELYDNAWTDAYEELEQSGKDEKVHIDTLYNILVESYMACKDISRQQLMDIAIALTEPKPQESPSKEKSSGDTKLSALQSKAVTELRKQSSDEFVKTLQTFMKEKWKQGKTTSSWFDKRCLQTYTMTCIQLCWYMHVQAPPVYIDLKVKSGEKFDTNKFKQYMKSGKKVDFVVWPPLLLHEGGSLLSKGVAQGK